MKRILSLFISKDQEEPDDERGDRFKSGASVGSSESGGLCGRRILLPTWPVFDITEPDPVEYADDVSIISVDMFVWKSAPTDNEAPPVVSKSELRKHNCSIDAWIAFQGLVYDVTTFLNSHPGGANQLMRGAGRDSTNLFMKVHPNVNVRNYVGNHCVGVYIPNGKSPCSLSTVVSKVPSERKQESCPEEDNRCWLMKVLKDYQDPEAMFDLKFTQNEFIVVLFIKAPPVLANEDLNSSCWTFVLWENEMLLIKVMWSPEKCWVGHYRLNQVIDSEYLYVSFKEKNQATLMIPKGQDQTKWSDFGVPDLINRNCMVQDPLDVDFDDSTRALLFYRQQLTSKVILYGFKLRPSSYFGVPMGYSIVLTVDDNAARIYPTSFTLLGVQEPVCDIKGQTFYFMVPQEFKVTQVLNHLRSMTEKEMLEASYIRLGTPKGDFQWNFLDNVDVLVLLVYGIGIAPLSRILRHYEEKHPEHVKNNQVLLLYFNKSGGDIIWHKELVEASNKYRWFHLFLIVEEADSTWNQLIGSISVHLVKWCINAIPSVVFADGLMVNGLASGNSDFLEECERVFQNMQDIFDNAAVFHPIKEVEV